MHLAAITCYLTDRPMARLRTDRASGNQPKTIYPEPRRDHRWSSLSLSAVTQSHTNVTYQAIASHPHAMILE